MPVFQPSTKDNFLQANATGDNNGTSYNIVLSDLSSSLYHGLITFDISAGAYSAGNIKSAILNLYYFELAGGVSALGKQVNAYKLKRTDWEEGIMDGLVGISNWIKYKTGVSPTGDWQTAGATGANDIDTTLTGNSTMPAVNNWLQIDITDIVKDAITNNSSIVDIMVRFNNETKVADGDPTYSVPRFYSKNELTNTTLRPKLVVTTNSQGNMFQLF